MYAQSRLDRVRDKEDIELIYEALWFSISHSKIPALDEVFRHMINKSH